MTNHNQGRKKKRITYTASKPGIEKAEKALRRLGFTSKNQLTKSILLSRTTVTKFFQCQPIELDSFKTICDKLTLNWEKIAEFSETNLSLELPEKTDDNANSFFAGKTLSLINFCCEEVKKPGSMLRIKAPWQMGKTTLVSNILNHFKHQDYKIIF